MSHPGLAVASAYDVRAVTLSVFMAIASAYTATTLARNAAGAPKNERNLWLAGTAAAICVGIWATHFILDGAAAASFLGAVGIAAVILSFLVTATVTAIRDKRLFSRALRERTADNKDRTLFESSPAAIYQASPDGTLLDLNEACAQSWGYASRDEARRANIQTHFADPAEFTTLVRSLETHGKAASQELRFLKRDGTILRVLQNAAMIDGDRRASKVIQATFTGITETKNTTEGNDPALMPPPSDLLALGATLRLAAKSVLVGSDDLESQRTGSGSVEPLEGDAVKSEPVQPSSAGLN